MDSSPGMYQPVAIAAPAAAACTICGTIGAPAAAAAAAATGTTRAGLHDGDGSGSVGGCGERACRKLVGRHGQRPRKISTKLGSCFELAGRKLDGRLRWRARISTEHEGANLFDCAGGAS